MCNYQGFLQTIKVEDGTVTNYLPLSRIKTYCAKHILSTIAIIDFPTPLYYSKESIAWCIWLVFFLPSNTNFKTTCIYYGDANMGMIFYPFYQIVGNLITYLNRKYRKLTLFNMRFKFPWCTINHDMFLQYTFVNL